MLAIAKSTQVENCWLFHEGLADARDNWPSAYSDFIRDRFQCAF